MLTTPEDIDALLAAEKRLAGRPAWSKSRENTVRISVPLQIGDAIVGSLFLAGTACFGLFTTKHEPSKDTDIAECAGLSGQARVDCEQRHQK